TMLSAILLIVATVTWGLALARNGQESHLSVHFLQTSHGESIFIETPNGNRMLIDGGGDASQVADTLGSMLPFWDREIDIVLLTHPDTDHVGGLPEVLRRFTVGTVLHSGQNSASNAFASWSAAVENHDNAVVVWSGMQIGLDHDTTIEVLSGGCIDANIQCADSNETSIVTMLRHRNVSFLLTGDIERSAEVRLAISIPNLRATVLKAPHHGSNTSSTATLINAVEPAAVVVAAGTANRYGHPHPEVIERYSATVGQERVLRTDQLGTVKLRTDGERLWMVR
ncbi:MAG: MBL fold metallo-hydrolase, partial [Chloroflexi bacterium]|nr:MBL fold metallo-hydrolase [Chloroflexota bacterium]